MGHHSICNFIKMSKINLSKPILSIVIPNYNHGHFIGDALNSLLLQSFQDFELIVIDDGSTDNSIEIINQYKDKFKNFKLITYPANKGVFFAGNHGLYIAEGQYIHWLAADDFREKGFIEECIAVLLKNQTIPMCCSDFGYSNEKTGRYNFFSEKLLKDILEPLVIPPSSLILLLSKSNFWIAGHTVVINRELIIKYGGYKQELLEKCDWYLFHLIALREGLVYVPKTLSYIYQHAASYSARATSTNKLKRKSANAILHQLKFDNENFTLFLRSTILKVIIRQNLFLLFKSIRVWLLFYYCLNNYHFKKLLQKVGFE